MVRTFAGMLVILALSTLTSTAVHEQLQAMYLFRFYKCNSSQCSSNQVDIAKSSAFLFNRLIGTRFTANALPLIAMVRSEILSFSLCESLIKISQLWLLMTTLNVTDQIRLLSSVSQGAADFLTDDEAKKQI
jgi:hypothetical protein